MAIDKIDAKLVELIQTNGRASYAELGELVGLSVSAVNERLKKLHTQGIIQAWGARVDAKAVGLDILSFVQVLIGRPNFEKSFKKAVLNFPEVEECHHITGEWSYLLKVRTRTMQELEQVISQKIQGEEGVQRTHTLIAISSPKEWTPLKITIEED